MRTLAPVALLALLVALVPAPTAQAQSCNGLGVTPGELSLTDGQAGQTYRYTVSVQNNPGCPQLHVQGTISGDVPSWYTLAPASFDLAAAPATQTVEVLIRVPDAQGPRNATTYAAFAADPPAGGNGTTIIAGVAVTIHAQVGGTATHKLTWGAIRVEDATVDTDVHAFAAVRNDGNVRTTAAVHGEVQPQAEDKALRQANGTLALDPGEEKEVPVTFAQGLAVGQYRAHLTADGLDATMPFKVGPAGSIPPDGLLRAILHAPRGKSREPVRIDAWFTNTGKVPIRSAHFQAEVLQGTKLLAPLQSDALAVQPGQSVNLTAYWTPPSGGAYTITGHVVYDGYLTPDSVSLLNVDAAPAAWWLWAALAGLVVMAAVLTTVLIRRRHREAVQAAARLTHRGPARPPAAPARAPGGPARPPPANAARPGQARPPPRGPPSPPRSGGPGHGPR